MQDGNKRYLYVNFNLKYGLGVELVAYEGKTMKAVLTLYDAYRSFGPLAQ